MPEITKIRAQQRDGAVSGRMIIDFTGDDVAGVVDDIQDVVATVEVLDADDYELVGTEPEPDEESEPDEEAEPDEEPESDEESEPEPDEEEEPDEEAEPEPEPEQTTPEMGSRVGYTHSNQREVDEHYGFGNEGDRKADYTVSHTNDGHLAYRSGSNFVIRPDTGTYRALWAAVWYAEMVGDDGERFTGDDLRSRTGIPEYPMYLTVLRRTGLIKQVDERKHGIAYWPTDRGREYIREHGPPDNIPDGVPNGWRPGESDERDADGDNGDDIEEMFKHL